MTSAASIVAAVASVASIAAVASIASITSIAAIVAAITSVVSAISAIIAAASVWTGAATISAVVASVSTVVATISTPTASVSAVVAALTTPVTPESDGSIPGFRDGHGRRAELRGHWRRRRGGRRSVVGDVGGRDVRRGQPGGVILCGAMLDDRSAALDKGRQGGDDGDGTAIIAVTVVAVGRCWRLASGLARGDGDGAGGVAGAAGHCSVGGAGVGDGTDGRGRVGGVDWRFLGDGAGPARGCQLSVFFQWGDACHIWRWGQKHLLVSVVVITVVST
jgi:hypothetical protein